jgi:hypothetical protein
MEEAFWKNLICLGKLYQGMNALRTSNKYNPKYELTKTEFVAHGDDSCPAICWTKVLRYVEG